MEERVQPNRRDFIRMTALAAGGITIGGPAFAGPVNDAGNLRSIAVFTKCLQFMNMGDMGALLAELGFAGADMPVRPGGQVLPENVKTGLPAALRELKKSGVGIPMITTAITNPDDPYTHDILKTAADLGIGYYRMGWLSYDMKKSIPENLDHFRRVFEAFDKLHRKYGIRGEYQNHAGRNLGSTVWDLYEVLKEVDPEYTGVQYDVRHATVEGGNSWVLGMQLIKPWIGTTDIKDFIWEKNNNGRWTAKSVPLGEGMVDFETWFREFRTFPGSAPISIHYEYDLGGAEHGNLNPGMPLSEIRHWLAKDLAWLKKSL
jgi:sugar phosphate isomerase/epimerase